MKFPVNNCMACGLDLTTGKPVEVKSVSGEETGVTTCPQCSAPYWMVEDTAIPLDAPAPEPELSMVRSSRRRASGPVAEPPEPEPEAEPAAPEPEP